MTHLPHLILKPIARCTTSERVRTAVANERRWFAQLRAELGWSQFKAAEFLGVSLNTVQRWETTNTRYFREVPAWAVSMLEQATLETSVKRRAK